MSEDANRLTTKKLKPIESIKIRASTKKRVSPHKKVLVCGNDFFK